MRLSEPYGGFIFTATVESDDGKTQTRFLVRDDPEIDIAGCEWETIPLDETADNDRSPAN